MFAARAEMMESLSKYVDVASLVHFVVLRVSSSLSLILWVNSLRLSDTRHLGTACQRRDWPSHKEDCRSKAAEAEAANGKAWYDRNRKCEDGTSHFGQLELITWSGFQSEISEELGWGNCVASESAELKRKYEEQFKSDDTRMYRYWPQGFRWTCCGLAGDQRAGVSARL